MNAASGRKESIRTKLPSLDWSELLSHDSYFAGTGWWAGTSHLMPVWDDGTTCLHASLISSLLFRTLLRAPNHLGALS